MMTGCGCRHVQRNPAVMTSKRRLRLWIAAATILMACGGLSNAFADDADATKAANKLVDAPRAGAGIDIPRPSMTPATARHRRRSALRARHVKRPAAIQVAYR